MHEQNGRGVVFPDNIRVQCTFPTLNRSSTATCHEGGDVQMRSAKFSGPFTRLPLLSILDQSIKWCILPYQLPHHIVVTLSSLPGRADAICTWALLDCYSQSWFTLFLCLSCSILPTWEWYFTRAPPVPIRLQCSRWEMYFASVQKILSLSMDRGGTQ